MLPIDISPPGAAMRSPCVSSDITGDHGGGGRLHGDHPDRSSLGLHGAGLFVSFMQAFIFTVLSMIYISGP